MLSEFGQLGRVLMPPAGTIAIAEFTSAPAARVAFAGLAYRRFKESVLFLEKAPRGLFTTDFDATSAGPNTAQLAALSRAKDAKPSAADLLEPAADTSTLFVRNLNFTTTSTLLADTFSPIDGFMSARVKTKTDPKKPGQTLSMGFGFIEFRTKAAAEAARVAMDGFLLEGHKLLIKASHKGADAAEERRKEDGRKKEQGKRTKIIIKNLPFEASKKDVRALFGYVYPATPRVNDLLMALSGTGTMAPSVPFVCRKSLGALREGLRLLSLSLRGKQRMRWIR